MVIADQRDFTHISSQVDIKGLKPVEELKILSLINDCKKMIHASLQLYFEQGFGFVFNGYIIESEFF